MKQNVQCAFKNEKNGLEAPIAYINGKTMSKCRWRKCRLSGAENWENCQGSWYLDQSRKGKEEHLRSLAIQKVGRSKGEPLEETGHNGERKRGNTVCHKSRILLIERLEGGRSGDQNLVKYFT